MYYLGALAVVEIVLAIHAVRTGRMRPWLWIILFVPVAGSIVYVATQLFHLGEPRVRPDAISEDVSGRIARGEYAEAIAIAETAVAGETGAPRARLLYLLALATFADDSPARAKGWLDELDRMGSSYRSRERTQLRQEVYAELYAAKKRSAA